MHAKACISLDRTMVNTNPCTGGCGRMLTFVGCYCKFCSKELGVPCDPEGKKKAYNDKSNPIHNPFNNPKSALVRLDARRTDKRASTAALPNLSNILRYSDEYLRACVAMAFRRPEVMEIWAAGSFYFTYIFFWTCECGRRATTKQLKSAERMESTNALRRTDNPLLVVPMPDWSGVPRKLVHSDIHFQGSPAVILRLAIGLCVDELAEVEREVCCLTRRRTLGFAGNRQDGGTAKEKLATGLDEFTGILVDKGGEQLAELYAGTTHRRRPSLRRWATGIGVARACECRVGVHEW
jgi:hypothetical protein